LNKGLDFEVQGVTVVRNVVYFTNHYSSKSYT